MARPLPLTTRREPPNRVTEVSWSVIPSHWPHKASGNVLNVAIFVDDAIWPWRGRRWAHLVSDESYDELHAFAARLGVPRRAFQGDHYDVPSDLRETAIELGALAVGSRELLRRLRG